MGRLGSVFEDNSDFSLNFVEFFHMIQVLNNLFDLFWILEVLLNVLYL
jgi:hypothetical protein